MTASPVSIKQDMLSSPPPPTGEHQRQKASAGDASRPGPKRSPLVAPSIAPGVSQEAWYGHIQRLLQESSALSGKRKLPARVAATSPTLRRGPFSPSQHRSSGQQVSAQEIIARHSRSTSTAPVQRSLSPPPRSASASPVRVLPSPLLTTRQEVENGPMSDVRHRLAEMDVKLNSHLQQLRQWSTPSTEMAMNKRFLAFFLRCQRKGH